MSPRALAFLVAIGMVAIGLTLIFSPGGPGPKPDPVPTVPAPTTKVTAVTFVYEKDLHVVPAPVLAALNKLNREKKIVATTFEKDVKDGTGEVPEQYRVALDAATKAGLPALVVLAGKDVLRVVKDPRSEQDVLNAVEAPK